MYTLYHSGVKGMKWGVRRYQNKDGSLTAKGKKRYAREARENDWKIGDDGIARTQGKKSKQMRANPDKWVKEDLERHGNVANKTKNTLNDAQNLNNSIGKVKNRNVKRMDLNKMTDKEMRERINREILERQYDDMFNPKKVSKGRERVNDVLDIAGPAVGIVGSSLGIALAIKQLKG